MDDKAKILVIEDQIPVAMLMVFLLHSAGGDVQVAANGRAAMELATMKKFDLSAIDLDLPDLSGLEICRELKQRHISYRTPVVLISGQATAEKRQKALDLGATDFIEKPFKADDFVARISSCIKPQSRADSLEFGQKAWI